MDPHEDSFEDSFDGAGPDGANDVGDVADAADGDPVEHLWNAAHEMLRAFRTLIDAADEFVESQRGRGPARGASGRAREAREPREGRVHHIDIDVDDAPDTGSRAGGGVA